MTFGKNRFNNSRATAFLASIPDTVLESASDTLTARCKFNFSYLCKQPDAGKDFSDLSREELQDLFAKLAQFSREPLSYWERQAHGRGKTLAIYNKFPSRSAFTHPKHVPSDVAWGRFRISGACRLPGFVVPAHLGGQAHRATRVPFDCNTFYVVFIDDDHRFWMTGDV